MSGFTALPVAVAALLDAASAHYHVPRYLARAVAWVESEGKHTDELGRTLPSKRGALGVMQLRPGTAYVLGVDPHDLHENIDGGVRLLGHLLRLFGGNERRAVAAYNAGADRVKRIPWPEETSQFVRRVMARAAEEKGHAAHALLPGDLRRRVQGSACSASRCTCQ